MCKQIIYHGGRRGMKTFLTYQSFIMSVQSGKKSIVYGPDYVVLSRNVYDKMVGHTPKSKESRPTVKASTPAQQRKGKICPVCNGDKHLFQNGNFSTKPCWKCKGLGRLRPIA